MFIIHDNAENQPNRAAAMQDRKRLSDAKNTWKNKFSKSNLTNRKVYTFNSQIKNYKQEATKIALKPIQHCSFLAFHQALDSQTVQVTHGHALFPFLFFVFCVAASGLDRLRIRLPSTFQTTVQPTCANHINTTKDGIIKCLNHIHPELFGSC